MAARAHAQREAHGLNERQQRKADAHRGGDGRVGPGDVQRIQQGAAACRQHGKKAGGAQAQGQRPHVAGEQRVPVGNKAHSGLLCVLDNGMFTRYDVKRRESVFMEVEIHADWSA